VKPCPECFDLTESIPCARCADPRRDKTVICVVEEASDIPSIERSAEYRGLYHVLGGRLAPLDGIGPDELTVTALVSRVTAGEVREVIVATNPKLEGEATALYLQEQLREAGVVVSRLARGLPVGGDLEYADGGTIAQALSARRVM
jgi:recombination protein RecR